jgi:hypothetical protein
MVKLMLIGIWAVGLLSGSIYFFSSSQPEEGKKLEATGEYFGGLDYV